VLGHVPLTSGAMHVTHPLAYAGLGLMVAGQAAGVPLPAESGLIAAAIVASRGHLDIVAVVLVAEVAAIAGGFAGFVGALLLGRPVLGSLQGRSAWFGALVDAGEGFFARHGPKAVFLARWISGVRIVAAPLAGAHKMRARTFAWWNVAGGVLWPASIGAVAYALGQRVAVLLGTGVVVVAVMLILAGRRRRAPQRRRS
jgi:membrane protein DedA with SNARE-associated domain